jgi:ABC-type nitrate/sulfonate/bicarbonate transport system substrate-binding protein
MLTRRVALAGAATIALSGAILGDATPAAAQQGPLKVIVFRSLTNLPLLAAQEKGFLAKENIQIEIVNTPNSKELREGLAAGRYQIAHAAVDNAVAQIEIQKVDAAIVMGGDGGLNTLFVQPEISSIKDLKGKTVGVDAPNTAFALLLYKMLKVNGLERDKDFQVKPIGGTPLRLKAMMEDKSIAAAMLNPPFSFQALDSGKLKSLGSPSAIVGPYQSGGVWVLRSWAKANEDLLVRYIRANVQGMRWAMDPANKAAAEKLLSDKLNLSPQIAAKSLATGLDPKAGGFYKDLAFDIEGFKTVLALRAEMEGQWGGKPPAPDKYLDMSFYQKALASLK